MRMRKARPVRRALRRGTLLTWVFASVCSATTPRGGQHCYIPPLFWKNRKIAERRKRDEGPEARSGRVALGNFRSAAAPPLRRTAALPRRRARPNLEGTAIKNRATILGIAAIFVWSLMVGLLRTTTNIFGAELGAALLYSVGAVFLFIVNRPTNLRAIPVRYFIVGGTLFVAYETIFALAIGFAATEGQTIEVSMLNYLWPTCTVLFWAIAHKRGQGRSAGSLAWIMPGTVIATLGVVLAVGGEEILRSGTLFAALFTNPLPYALAFIAAILWGLYNTAAPALAEGANATAFFFVGIAVTLWVVYLAQGAPAPPTAIEPVDALPLLATAVAVATGYALWGYGVTRGDMQKLSVASYAAPILSSISSSVILATTPGPVFWVGAALVAAGSIASWLGSQCLVRKTEGKQGKQQKEKGA